MKFPASYKPSLFRYFKMAFKTKNHSNVAGLKDQIPQVLPDLKKIHQPANHPQLTWLGHSSLLLQYRQKNYLFDPVYSLPFLGPKRYTPAPLSLEEMPPIDTIFISHNHYDHLDKKVVKFFNDEVQWIVPKGLKKWFKKNGVSRVIELSWWEKEGVATATPTQHWSKRTLFDTLKSHWCSYFLEWDDFNFFFGADTGFNQAMFEEIGQKFAPIDLSALPIGAYAPEWFMHPFHINPEEAIAIHHIIQSKMTVPIHWGTFSLSFEPITEPLERVKDATNFHPLAIGETLIYPLRIETHNHFPF